MSVIKSEITGRYNLNKLNGTPVLITPEASKLLRGLLRLTLQRAADFSSIKRNQLEHFENDNRPLSARSKRWLQSMFESAGAEFFMGQGELYVTVKGEDVISQGERAERLIKLPLGRSCRAERVAREGLSHWWLSQNELAKITGVPQCRISAIENHRHQKFYLADQVALQKAFQEIPKATI